MKIKWKNLEPAVKQAGMRALSDGAEHLLGEANKRVPHDEGNLQRSGIVSLDPNQGQANISYDTPYAARLHEHPEYEFQEGREGKWLERTIEGPEGDRAMDYIAKEFKKVFRG